MVVLGSFAFSVTSYSFVAAQNVTSTAPTGNATTGGNLTTSAPTATAPGNATGVNQTGGGTTTANATGEIDTFHARGQIASIVSGGNASGSSASLSAAGEYVLGGTWRIDVTKGDVQRVEVNMSMAKPDGSDFHRHLMANFTAGGAANETATSNATAPTSNATAGNATASGNTSSGSNATTMQQTITGANNSSNLTGGGNATTTAENVSAPSNQTMTASQGKATISQDSTFKISGMINIYTNGELKWQNVPITIESTGRVLTINVDSGKTDNHFMGKPIYGFVTALVGSQNGNIVSLLPSLTSSAAPATSTPAPTGPTTSPTSNATTANNMAAPMNNSRAASGNATNSTTSSNATAANQTSAASGGSSNSSAGGAATTASSSSTTSTTAVSISPGSSSKTDNAFDPNPVKAKLGDTITWTNHDSTPHTVTSGTNAKPDGKFNSSPGFKTLISPGQTFSHKFTEAGEYPYFCQLHPNMVGTVSVR
jgi:plastocyanin